MDRREFVQKAIGGSVLLGSSLAMGGIGSALARSLGRSAAVPDLVAIKGGEPDVMFDRAIETYGGMSHFVRKGSTVLVKPNIGWDVTPDRGGNTHPALVKRVIEHCFNAGAREVTVFDHTCDNWSRCYKNSGIEKAVKDANGKIVSGDSEGYYQQAAVPKGKRLTQAKVHDLLLSADVFINVPVLKHHGSTRLTAGMKNLMGVVWDREYWHRNDLHQCIADMASYRKPDLTVIDAYYVMKRNGPRGVSAEDVLTLKTQLLSPDVVAADAAAAKLWGVEPGDVAHITIAEEMGLGSAKLDSLNIRRLKV
jgi:uncharacterized protein (DUF362 family)